nr:MAG TPA: hypothetical protein [Caudoviricetes sp.]
MKSFLKDISKIHCTIYLRNINVGPVGVPVLLVYWIIADYFSDFFYFS